MLTYILCLAIGIIMGVTALAAGLLFVRGADHRKNEFPPLEVYNRLRRDK